MAKSETKYFLAIMASRNIDGDLQFSKGNVLTVVMNDRDELCVCMPVKIGSGSDKKKALVIQELEKFQPQHWKGGLNWASPWNSMIEQLKKKTDKKFESYIKKVQKEKK